MIESKQFIFIIGSPRSGTTMLQILLANHPQVASTVEQTLFQHYIGPWLDTWAMEVQNLEERGWKLGLPILWKEVELIEFLREFLDRAYGKILAIKPNATHILDKHPGYSLHVKTIKRFLPRARFIHMIRDGRDVASSMVAVHGKMGFSPAQLTMAAAKWKRFVLAARDAADFGADYLEIRYEDFLEGKPDAYARTLEFCGLPSDPAWIAETLAANSFEKMKQRGASPDPSVPLSSKRYHRGIAGGWRTDFSGWDRFEFDRIAGDLLRDLGYADAHWWAESATQRVAQPLRRAWVKRRLHLRRAIWNAYATVIGCE
jgi:Sulfotransferase family